MRSRKKGRAPKGKTKRLGKDAGPGNSREKERRRMFVALYAHPDYARNGTRAAIDAGYSPKSAHVQASRLLSDENIRAQVNAELARQVERTRVDSEIIVKELARIGKANLVDIVEVRMEKKGRSIRPALYLRATSLDQLSRDDTAAIRKLEITKDGIRIELYDKLQADHILMKHFGGQFRDPTLNPPPQRRVYTPEERLSLMIGTLRLIAARAKEPQEIPA